MLWLLSGAVDTKGIVSAHKDLLDKLATLLSIGDAQFYFRVRAVKQSALRRTAHSTKVRIVLKTCVF